MGVEGLIWVLKALGGYRLYGGSGMGVEDLRLVWRG